MLETRRRERCAPESYGRLASVAGPRRRLRTSRQPRMEVGRSRRVLRTQLGAHTTPRYLPPRYPPGACPPPERRRTSSKSCSTWVGRPEARFENDFVFLTDSAGDARGHRARRLAALAVRRRQSRGDRADAASDQRDSQSHREDRRAHLPRRPRGLRHDRHHPRRDPQREIDLLARAGRASERRRCCANARAS